MSRDATVPAAADVVVVGGGLGGLAAAVAAAEQGADVQLLEKAAEPGGSSAMSGGYVWSFPKVEDYQDLIPHGDELLGGLVIDDFETGIEWLREHGGRLGPLVEGLSTAGRGRGHRFDPDPVSAGVLPLVRALEAAGGRIATGKPVRELILDERGAVRGVVAGNRRESAKVTAKAVVLATGGFQGDLEMTTRYISRDADRFLLRAAPTGTGDGIRLAFAAGAAASAGLRSFYGHLMPIEPKEIEFGSFRRLSQFYSAHTIALNLDGRRFIDESRGDNLITLALAEQRRALAYLVFDAECHAEHACRPYLHDAVEADPLLALREVGGVVLEAASIEGLATLLADHGLPRQGTEATLRSYDEGAAAGDGGLLEVPRAGNLHRLQTAPFYAVPVRPGITFTGGGIAVDRECRALDRDGLTLPGLYAAGVDVGGISNEGYAGGLSAALVTGLRAGVHAAIAAERTPS
jgi:succinate dehydrogenase/fumarate reductase flavoprotein subunit